MKRLLVFFISTVFAVVGYAAVKDSARAVTMASYEQGWLDSEATVALTNNTGGDVSNVSFRITYLDMQGRQLDYSDFLVNTDIAPGMTKKVDIEAYEHGRNYSYYLSDAMPGRPHRFKVKFELLGYNVPGDGDCAEAGAPADSTCYGGYTAGGDGSRPDIGSILGWTVGGSMLALTLIMLFALGVTVGVFGLVVVMARNRNRSIVGWLLVSIFLTPFVAVVLLWLSGRSDGGPSEL